MQNSQYSSNNPAPGSIGRLPPRHGVSPTVVVLLCLVLGLALGWGWSGEQMAGKMANSLDIAKTNLTAIRSNQSELAALLSDSGTRVVPLEADSSVATASAAVIWNARLGRGVILCQELWPLPGTGKYHLKAKDPDGTTELASFTASGGAVTEAQFSIPVGSSPSGFELSAPSAQGAPQTLFTAARS